MKRIPRRLFTEEFNRDFPLATILMEAISASE